MGLRRDEVDFNYCCFASDYLTVGAKLLLSISVTAFETSLFALARARSFAENPWSSPLGIVTTKSDGFIPVRILLVAHPRLMPICCWLYAKGIAWQVGAPMSLALVVDSPMIMPCSGLQTTSTTSGSKAIFDSGP